MQAIAVHIKLSKNKAQLISSHRSFLKFPVSQILLFLTLCLLFSTEIALMGTWASCCTGKYLANIPLS